MSCIINKVHCAWQKKKGKKAGRQAKKGRKGRNGKRREGKGERKKLVRETFRNRNRDQQDLG